MILDLQEATSLPFISKTDRSLQIRCLRPTNRYHEALLIRGLYLESLLRPDAARFLFNYQLPDIVKRDAWMTIAQTPNCTVGGLYAHFDDDGFLWLRGAVVCPSASGNRLAVAMAATALQQAKRIAPHDWRATCAIRVLPDGTLNEASRRSFDKLGFWLGDDVGITRLDGGYANRHLIPHAEEDAHGPFIRYRRMFADSDATEKADDFLGAWQAQPLKRAA